MSENVKRLYQKGAHNPNLRQLSTSAPITRRRVSHYFPVPHHLYSLSQISKTLNPDNLSVQIQKLSQSQLLTQDSPATTTMPSNGALNVLEDVVLRSTASSSSSATSLGPNDVVLAVWSAHRRCKYTLAPQNDSSCGVQASRK